MRETLNPKSNEAWKAKAACRGLDSSIFYPASDEFEGPAKAVCNSCPVKDPCLEFALITNQKEGIWGGLNNKERSKVKRSRQLSRKHNK